MIDNRLGNRYRSGSIADRVFTLALPRRAARSVVTGKSTGINLADGVPTGWLTAGAWRPRLARQELVEDKKQTR